MLQGHWEEDTLVSWRGATSEGPPRRPTLQGQRDDAVAVSCVVTRLPLLAGRPSAAGAVMTAAASSAPISIVPVEMFIFPPALLVSAGL